MAFIEVLAQVREKLRSKGRVTYRALKREFDLDDDYLADLTAELIDAERVARDEGGKVLMWIGAAPVSDSTPQEEGSKFQVRGSKSGLRTLDPGHWTPPHLAERIRAEQTALAESAAATAPAVRWTASARPSPPCLLTSRAPRP